MAEIARRNSHAVVTIATESAQGSGFIIAANGIIVTNLHVLRGASHASVKLANGDSYEDVRILDADEQKDLLVLKVKAVELPFASVGNSESVRVGDHVVMIGNPRGLDRTVTDGVISAIRDLGGYRMFQTSAAASPGSSGGGLFNSNGELVAIAASKMTDGENLNFCVPVNYARGMVPDVSVEGLTLAQLAQRFPDKPRAAATRRTGWTQKSLNDHLEGLLNTTGMPYAAAGEGVWKLRVSGRNATATVMVSAEVDENDGTATCLALALIRRKPALPVDSLRKILERSFQANFAKAGLDADGDLYAVQELDVPTLDSSSLLVTLKGVANLVDEIYPLLGGDKEPQISEAVLPRRGSTRFDRTLDLPNQQGAFTYDSDFWRTSERWTGDELQLAHDNQVWAKIQYESLELDLSETPELALTLARKSDPNVRLVDTTLLRLDGEPVIRVEIEARMSGARFRVLRYFQSDSRGTVELSVWTTTNLIDRYRAAADLFAAGLRLRPRR